MSRNSRPAGLDRNQPIPETRRYGGDEPCNFCGGFKHFGWCDQMRAYNANVKPPQPHVVPLARSG